MSIEEQIAILETEKDAIVARYDEQIRSLKEGKALSSLPDSNEEAPPIRPGSRFRPVPNTGMPASEMILRDRG